MQLFEISFAYKFLGGFYLAMAVLHVLLYFYNRSRRSNLIYAAGMLMVFINFTFTQEPESWSGAHKLNVLTDLAANGALLYFVSYSVISDPRLKKGVQIFGWIYALGFPILLIDSRLQVFGIALEILLRSAIYFVIGVSCVIGVIRRIPYFLLIVVATLFLMLMHVLFGADLFNIWHGAYPVPRVVFLLIGFITPFIAYSAYLAKYLSIIKRNVFQEKLQAEKNREMDQLKSRFFTNISHEFRTPLTLLLGPLQRRLNESTRTEDKMELGVMHRNASRLLNLVNQLLEMSRIDAGMVKLACHKIDLAAFVKNSASQFTSIASSKSIDFAVSAEEHLLVYFDSDKLEKIINNLLGNAFKFTPEGGFVEVKVRREGPDEQFRHGSAVISVGDSGPGIDPGHLHRIFDRFFKVDHTTVKESEGSGIGLALVKELVDLHHGTIHAEQSPLGGALFTVRLHLRSSHLKPYEVLPDEAEPGAMRQATSHDGEPIHDEHEKAVPQILIVEDNADLRHYLTNSLQPTFNISEAQDGQEGIDKAINHVPDLILTDLMMPRINGLELCDRLKADERTSHIPIIMLTARADAESRLSAYRQGADDYMAKPFQMPELQVRIRNLIENRERIRARYKKQMTLKPSNLEVVSADDRFIKNAIQVVEQFLGDPSFGVERFAQECHVSHTQLYRKLQALTGLNPNEFIRHLRLESALHLLKSKSGNVSEVAYMVGFNNLSYFSKVFREKYNLTPAEFLRNPEGLKVQE